MNYANIELALLECLYNLNPSNRGYVEGLVVKAVKKYQKTLHKEHFEAILKLGKHNTSANRLYKLIKDTQPELAQEIKMLIKKYGHVL
ncbi:MAG: hypothetical protein LBP53_03060 [Candidatus Peribacteria bacterium]|jgi:hypothetical protein|nr:hypothetical protein [Candidatus Peribacteria bacterium]